MVTQTRAMALFVLPRPNLKFSLFLLYLALMLLSLFQTVIMDRTMTVVERDLRLFSNHTTNRVSNDVAHKTTLALLYPQGMFGGYRNQVMRFIGLVSIAKRNNIDQLLLPSLLWSTNYKAANNERVFYPIPMEMVFDIDHWNSFGPNLPFLVDSIKHSDCWDLHKDKADFRTQMKNEGNATFISPMAEEILEHNALLTPIIDTTRKIMTGKFTDRPRQFDLYFEVEHCRHPIVYGGGYGAGRLWDDFLSLAKVEPGKNTTISEPTKFTELLSLVSKALRPSPRWRDLAHECIDQHQTVLSQSKSPLQVSGYVALHARVEVDMMIHKCGKRMEKNLTRIFSMVEHMMDSYNQDPQHEQLRGLFVAVSRQGMLPPSQNELQNRLAKDNLVQTLMEENWKVLLERSSNETYNRRSRSSIFECGEPWMDRWYSMHEEVPGDYFGSLVPSVMNFYIATHASIFVGVQGSSYSNDVWSTRYYQGKGSRNFMYTPDGILHVPNGGLPSPHDKCK